MDFISDDNNSGNFWLEIKKLVKSLIKTFIGLFLLFSLLYQPFKIPSESMVPTLLIGDFLLVDKYCYGYTNDSFRMWNKTLPLPKFTKRIFASKKPTYGDVIVFHNPKDGHKNYIKRIIGMPGDKVQLKDGVVIINDKKCEITDEDTYSLMSKGEYRIFKKYTETLPNGYKHVIIKCFPFGKGHLDNVGPYNIPKGHYFVMGDNRDNSSDSRVMETCGFIPDERVMGQAKCLFFSSSCNWYQVFDWLFSIRYERIFTKIR